jgi:uncharacterized Zn finger protein
MEQIAFQVQGSSSTPYLVIFQKDGANLNASCSCAAGQNGQYCKHRISILVDGSKEGVVSENVDQVAVVHSWLHGTDVEVALAELAEAELKLEAAKRAVSSLKKRVAQALKL